MHNVEPACCNSLYQTDNDDSTGENTLLNSEDKREMVDFALEASCSLWCEDRERAEKKGESSTSHGSVFGHGSLATCLRDMPGSGSAHPLQMHLGGPDGFPVKGSHGAQMEESCQADSLILVMRKVPIPDQTPPSSSSRFMVDQEVFHLQYLIGASRSEGGHTFL